MMWNLPKSWTWTLLGPHVLERSEAIGSLAPEEAARFDRLRGVSNREGIIDPPFDRVRPIKDPSRYVVLRVGYFAYNPMRINVGSIGLVRGEAQAGKISPDYVVFTTRRTLLPEYLFAYLKSDVGRQIIRASTAGAVRERLYFRDLARLPIPLPPLPEQRRIVRLLDAAEELRRLRDQADRRTADLIPAIFHEMFGEPTTNSRGWPVKPFSEVCESRLGKMLDAKKQTGKHARPYLRNLNVQWGRLDLSTVFQMDFDEDERREFRLQPGDVLICEGGAGVGQTAIWQGELPECYFQKSLHRVRPYDGQAVSEYVAHLIWMLMKSDGFLSSISSATIPHLTGVKLKSVRIPIPPLPLQEKFAKCVREARALEAQQAASRRRLDDLYQSLLHRAFRGEV